MYLASKIYVLTDIHYSYWIMYIFGLQDVCAKADIHYPY